jgi:glycosyl-4,4'-diaponeurosporenoate acyltransferase
MKAWEAVAIDSALWALWGAVVGLVGSKLPALHFAADGPLTRMRHWERGGRLWAVVGVRRWKRFVPDLGWLTGDMRKKHSRPGADFRQRLAVETRRAEVVHWAACVPILVMPLWGPAWIFGVMVTYAFCANVPCIIIQRYNRGRLLHLASRRAIHPSAIKAVPASNAADLARKIVG